MDPMTISALASAGASLFNKKKGVSGVTGPQVVTLPQYSFTEPRLKLTSDFISGNLQNLSEGKFPTYYQNAMPTLKKNMSTALRDTYFGSQGMQGPGILQQVRDTGAALGTGAKAVVARENKALYDYAAKETQIDEYLVKLGVDIAQNDARTFTQLSIGMPQGPSAVVLGGQGYNVPQAPDYLGQAINTISGALPYLQKTTAPPAAAQQERYPGYYDTYVGPGGVSFQPSSPPPGYNYNYTKPVDTTSAVAPSSPAYYSATGPSSGSGTYDYFSHMYGY